MIFLADHGISLGSHGISGKQTMYEEGIRLPLIIRYPRLKRRSSVATELVSLIDIFPTMCDAAGLAVPPSVEGTSLLDAYRGAGSWARDRIHAAFVSPHRHRLDSRCIRTSRFKFIQQLTTDETELYDLVKDPNELRNLAGLKGYATVEKRLASELRRWRQRSEPITERLQHRVRLRRVTR